MTTRMRLFSGAAVAWALASIALTAQIQMGSEPIALANPGAATKLALDAALAGVGPATAPESEPLPRYDASQDVKVADLLRACVPETRAYYARLVREHMRLSTSYAPAPAPAPGRAQARRSTDENEARQILLQDAGRTAQTRPFSAVGDLAFYENELSAGTSSTAERHRFLACISWRRAQHPVVSPGLPPPADPKPSWTVVPLAKATPDMLSADLVAGCRSDLVNLYRAFAKVNATLPWMRDQGAKAGAAEQDLARFSKTTGTSDGDARQLILWIAGIIRTLDKESAASMGLAWKASVSPDAGPERFSSLVSACLANRRVAQLDRGALVVNTAAQSPARTGSRPAQILGRWSISLTCANGTNLNEPGAVIENDASRHPFTWGNGGEGFTALVFSRDDEVVLHVDGVVDFKGLPAAWPVHVVAGMYNGAYRGLGAFGPGRACPFVMSPAK